VASGWVLFYWILRCVVFNTSLEFCFFQFSLSIWLRRGVSIYLYRLKGIYISTFLHTCKASELL
jgi:hypothetical protein